MNKKEIILAELAKDCRIQNYQNIADLAGVDKTRVAKYSSEYGYSCNKRWPKEKDGIIKDYIAGFTLEELGDKYHHYADNIRKKLIEWGVDVKTQSQANQKYKVNENYFEVIDSHEKAYFLGFLYADGNIYINESLRKNVVQICLSECDRYILEYFLKCLDAGHPLYREDRNKTGLSNYPNGQVSYRLLINNVKLVSDLQKLGLHPQKSKNMEFPTEDQVPKEYWGSFIAGIMDGDGSICIEKNGKGWSTNLISTKPFLEKIQLIFHEKLGFDINSLCQEKRTGDGKMWYLGMGGGLGLGKTKIKKHKIPKLYTFLYSNLTKCLSRKKDKYLQLLETIYNNDYQQYL